MSDNKTFPVGSVADNLMRLRGTWHDQISLFKLDGSPLADDSEAGAGSPGPSPFDNLVYFDFDGTHLSLTNVPIRGRPLKPKTFRAQLQDNVLVFDSLGPGAFENIAMSGGPGILTLNARELNSACQVYMEPDFIIMLSASERVRHTVLYRNGIAVRTLTAHGQRLSPLCDKRHSLDPRGESGPVHEESTQATIWRHLVE